MAEKARKGRKRPKRPKGPKKAVKGFKRLKKAGKGRKRPKNAEKGRKRPKRPTLDGHHVFPTPKPIFYCHCLSHGAAGRIRTLDLRLVSHAFYHSFYLCK
jgi:hypothetical protein